MGHLRRFCSRSREAERTRRQGVIAAMRVVLAAAPLLLDVSNLAVRCDFAIAAGDAPARERREAEKPDQTHHADPRSTLSNSCTEELVAISNYDSNR